MAPASLTRELISAYANNEGWKIDHVEAQLCRDFEDSLGWGCWLFERLLDLEAKMQARAFSGVDARTLSDLESMPKLYQQWLEASERCLDLAKEFTTQGYVVDGLETFEKAVDQARWICESEALEAEIRPYDEILKHLAPDNPDPSRYGS